MPSINIAADASKGRNELGKFGNALDSVTDRIKALNVAQATFNRNGVMITGVVRTQIGEFETLTQVIDRHGRVVSSTYTKNEEAARRAAAAADKRKKKEEDDAKKEAERLENQGTMVGNLLNRIGRNLVQFASYKAFNFITDQIQEGIAAAKDFQIQISLIRTISQGSQQSFVKFGQDIRNVSDFSGFDIKDVGKAFYDTTSNQIAKGANVAPFVKQATDLARVTGSELPDSVNLLSSAINAYGLSASEAERISAIFFKTIDEGRIVSSELANTFGRIAVLGSNLGVPLEELNAVLAITTQKGLKTSDAVTLLTNLLIKLEKPTDATRAFFESLGVESGEAAIALYGFVPLVNKMVAAVKSGQVDISAFFDEIRGRKQFGIFEQSGAEIQAFSDKLKDTSASIREYQEAVKIRGESPADQLNKEVNKLTNIFKVDLGQALVQSSADLIKFVGGVDNVSSNIKQFGDVTRHVIPILGAYAVAMGVVTVANYAAAVGFRAVGAAIITTLAPLAAAAAAYMVTRDILQRLNRGEGEKGVFGFDKNDIQQTLEVLEKMRVSSEKFAAQQKGAVANPYASITAQARDIDKAYGDVLGLLANANKVTNAYLENTKEKTRETTEALKVGFGTYTDTFKNKINDIKKGITEANTEVERSKKSLLHFKESLEDMLFDVRASYANDDFGQQKVRLTEQRLADLYAKKDKLFAEGTEESIGEGRKLYGELAKLERNLFELRTTNQQKSFEQYLAQNPSEASRPGGNVFTVSTEPLEQRLQALAAERAKDEERVVKAKQDQIKASETALKAETAQLRSLEIAIKRYEEVSDPFDKSGGIKKEFKDSSGKFDFKAYQASLKGAEEDIFSSNKGGSIQDRLALYQLIMDKRKAAIDEAAAYERAQDIKTAQAKLLTDKEAQQKRLEDLRKQREELLQNQLRLYTELGQKPAELASFGDSLLSGARTKISEEDKGKFVTAVNDYKKVVADLSRKTIVQDGIEVADPILIEATRNQYRHVLDVIKGLRAKYKIEAEPMAEGNAGSFDMYQGQSAIDAQVADLARTSRLLMGNITDEKADKAAFKTLVLDPVEKLKGTFPELAQNATQFGNVANDAFRGLANGGLEDLRKKLEEVQRLMKPPAALLNPGGGKVGALMDMGDAAYAATGGTVGLFPGQPRGQDVYPIWAAKGERIIDAATSAMYAPMLDAIMSRRAPQYMAGGGTVGGDTYVGDMNITVNESKSPASTGRVVGRALERQLRLNNIRLVKK